MAADFSKSTRLLKIRRIGFLQIRSRARPHLNPADYIPASAPAQAIRNTKIKVEWKITRLSFELADIRPRSVAPAASRTLRLGPTRSGSPVLLRVGV